MNLDLACEASGGMVYFACPQLETGEIANRANLLTNGSNPGLNSAKKLLTNYVTKVTDRIIDAFSKLNHIILK